MTHHKLKRLITGFLVLSVAVTSTTLILLNFQPAAPAPQPTTDGTTQGTIPAIGSNAFVEPLPNDAVGATAVGDTASNLTNTLADSLASEIIKKNPDGPQDINGEVGITAPNVTVVATQALNDQSQNLALPDWERDVAAQHFTILDHYTPNDVATYNETIRALLDQRFVQSGIASLPSTNAATQDLTFAKIELDRALTTATNLRVPKQLAGFHAAFVRVLVYQRNMFALTMDWNDPARTALTLNAVEPNYERALAALTKEYDGVVTQKEGFSYASPAPTPLSFLADLASIKTAHAFLSPFVFDLSWWSQLARDIGKYLKTLVLEVLKDQLIHRLVQQTITWVQGGGKPQFITNWQSFLRQAGENAAGQAIADIAPGFCRSFGPLVQLRLKSAYTTQVPISCTLDQVVQNVNAFYDSFSNGSWLAYGASIMPSGNFYGTLFEGSKIAAIQRSVAEVTASSKAQAGKGFNSTKKICVKWYVADMTPEQEQYAKQQDADYVSSSCSGNSCKVKFCNTDGWQDTTPASFVGDTLGATVANSPISRIVNAQDVVALVSALINSGLMKLINAGSRGLTGLAQGGAGEPPAGGVSGTDPCAGLSGQDLADCRTTSGQVATSTGQDLEQQKADLTTVADNAAQQFNDIADTDSRWLALQPTAIASLTQVAAACATLTADANNKINDLNVMVPSVQAELAAANASSSAVTALRDQIGGVTSIDALSGISDQINAIHENQTTGNLFSQAQDRYTALTILKDNADANLPNKCDTPL